MSRRTVARMDDIAVCVRSFVRATVRGANTPIESFADGFFSFRDGEKAEYLVARVVETLEETQSYDAAQALGISEEDWGTFAGQFLR